MGGRIDEALDRQCVRSTTVCVSFHTRRLFTFRYKINDLNLPVLLKHELLAIQRDYLEGQKQVCLRQALLKFAEVLDSVDSNEH